MDRIYDYIIVGAGSAGCILADRLSASGEHRVLLLEAGGEDKSFWFKLPVGYIKSYFNPQTNWMFYTTPQTHLNGRSLYAPRGKVLGGSGSINAMIYVQGQRKDFDDWREAGNPGWGFDDVRPYFRQLENHPQGRGAGRGDQGRIGITPMKGLTHPLCDDYLAACDALGLPRTEDFNGAQFEGAGIYETNIRRGQRSSSSIEYLAPARSRDNLTVMTHTQALRLLYAPGAANRVVGVRVRQGGRDFDVQATQEVILSAGALGSPQLLQCSGIGDGEELKALGIDVRQHLPRVGRNLQDHLCASFYYRANRPTLNDEFNSLWGQMRAGLQYLLTRRGPLSLSVNQAGGFFKGADPMAQPNLQLYFNPLSYTIPASPKASLKPEPYSGFLMAFNACRPSSTGQIKIQSADATVPPLIDPNYLSTAHDQEEVLQAMRLIRRLSEALPLQRLIAQEVAPGLNIQSDEQLLAYFKAQCGSIYHLCGTCAMGPDTGKSVVDSELRVHGVRGLRVIDASIFPNITSGNINAPTMMVAEKGADLVLASTGH
jgi:choline dehydrogenase